MAKWYTRLLEQKQLRDGASQQSDFRPHRPSATSTTEFTYMRDQGNLENPYRQEEDDEEDDAEHGPNAAPFPVYSSHSEFPASRNGSNTSLRSRSTTGDSGPPPGMGIKGRMPPPRLPPGSFGQQTPLTLRTHHLPGYIPSPAERMAESYFSPSIETPMSSRTSASLGMYPFPRQPIPANSYYEDGNHGRYTAPVMSRVPSRESNAAAARVPPRPSLPANGLYSAQQIPTVRNRSASSPDIHGQRRAMSGPRPPMPGPVPSHTSQYAHNGISPRSQSNSPNIPNGTVPRVSAQSPKTQRDRSYGHPMQESTPQFPHDNTAGARADPRFAHISASSRSHTPVQSSYSSIDQAISPPLASSSPVLPGDAVQPTQLKVKVHATAAGQVLTLVVPLNISFQSLKDRIDAKLQRSTNISLTDRSGNQVKLKYLDEEDFVSIQSDEDVQTAFETWREQRGEGVGGMGEIELFCQ